MGPEEKKNLEWEYDWEEKAVKFNSVEVIPKDEPLSLFYGHSSNYTYFFYYGFTLDEPEYGSIGFVLLFGEDVPNGKEKLKLLNKEVQGYKVTRFFQYCKTRYLNNRNFFSTLRFYYSEKPMEELKSLVEPAEVSFDESRKSIMEATKRSEDTKMFSKILREAKKIQESYTTSLESDEENIKSSTISFPRKCCYRHIIGEKHSLALLIDQCTLSLKLLGFPTQQEAVDYYRSLSKKVNYSYFIKHEVLTVDWSSQFKNCLLYTSDAADDTPCVDLGGRRIIKKKKKIMKL
eukprot:TRINITY_DN6943_c0_g1_i4.p1 TRINITY_DN6943_c0_g1~~TRINITY_DN6943_c0_g1_i4.p1  ORF type:complete len:290 (-),score=55.63 TRINITY_DN6943_c0_g1_i4:94-963(-)